MMSGRNFFSIKVLATSSVMLGLFMAFIITATAQSHGPIWIDENKNGVFDAGEWNGTSIQRAVENATDGDTIYVWNGTYNENIVVSKRVNIIGNDSAGCKVIAADNATNVFTITAGYVNISGLNISGANDTGKAAIALSNVEHCNISDNTLYGNSYGIYLYSSSNNTVTGCSVYNNTWGIYLYSSSNNNNISGNTVYNNSYGIRIYDTGTTINHGNIIADNNVYNNSITGIYLRNSNDSRIDGNILSNNTQYDILVEYSNYTTITNNTAEYSSRGITVSHSHHNTVFNNTAMKNTMAGIRCEYSNYNAIRDNTVNQNNYGKGIYLYYSNHSILDNNTASSNDAGIQIERSINDTISNNTVNSNVHGIYCKYSDYSIIRNNTANSNSYDSIYLYHSNHSLLDNNTANSSTQYYGIRLDYSINNTVSNNTAALNEEHGIYLLYSNSNRLLYNTLYKNTRDGIRISGSSINNVSYNTIYNNSQNGILIESYGSTSSINNTLFSNIIYNHTNTVNAGIYISSGPNNVLSNTIRDNYRGIYIDSTVDNNNISKNTLQNNIYGIYVSNSDYNEFYGDIICNTNRSTNVYGIYVTGSHNVIDNVTIYNLTAYNLSSSSSAYGVFFRSVSNTVKFSRIYNLSSDNNNDDGSYGIYLSSAGNAEIFNNTIYNTRVGIYIMGVSSHNNISLNRIHDARWGIHLYGLNAESNNIDSNTIYNVSGLMESSAIYIYPSAQFNTISNNILYNNTRGVYLWDNANNNTVMNNTIYRDDRGIEVRESSDNTIYDNYFNNVTTAIYLKNCLNITVYNNSIYWGYYGIYLDHTNYSSISLNCMTYNISQDEIEFYAIYLSYSNNSVIDNNTIEMEEEAGDDSDAYGVYLSYSSLNVIDSNSVFSYAGDGIHLYHSDQNEIKYNNISTNFTSVGVFTYDSSYNTIHHNRLYNINGGIELISNIHDAQHNILERNIIMNSSSYGIEVSSSSNTIDRNSIINASGIILDGSSDSTIVNNVITDIVYTFFPVSPPVAGAVGIWVGGTSAQNNFFSNNTIHNSNYNGIVYGVVIRYTGSNNIFENISVSNLSGTTSYGFYIYESSSNNITNSTITDCDYGIYITSSSNNNLIYNNYFNNTNNAYDNGVNTWNISKTLGRNIVGGPYLGGNYWSDYNGVDNDGDKLGDTLLPYNSSGNIVSGGDLLPLIFNNPPVTPYNPSPSDGATGVSTTRDISWHCYDPDGDNVTYDVYFGTTNPPPKVSANQTSTTYDPGTLRHSRTYYWRIVAWEETGLKTEGPVWHFKTRSLAGGGAVNYPPIADADGPYAGVVGETITFDGSPSHDPDGNIVNYTWDFGDGAVGYGVSPTHVYTVAGDYTVVLTVMDNFGATDSDTTVVTVTGEPNTPPIANAGGPYHGLTHQVITFDGSLSYDPDGNIVNYTWEFGDGSIGYGVNPSHIYIEGGNHTITLIVTDNNGLMNTSTTVAVIDQDTDGDGWSDKEESQYGSDPENPSSMPEDTDNDHTPDIIDEDDDNDGLPDDIEEDIDSNPKTKTNFVNVSVNGSSSYLVDVDGDGMYDIFYDPDTNTKTAVTQHNDGNYLIDFNDDGKPDYIYNPTSGVSLYNKEKPSLEIPWIAIVAVAIFIILAVAMIYLYRRRF